METTVAKEDTPGMTDEEYNALPLLEVVFSTEHGRCPKCGNHYNTIVRGVVYKAGALMATDLGKPLGRIYISPEFVREHTSEEIPLRRLRIISSCFIHRP